MLTIEELNKQVVEYFKDDALTLQAWNKNKNRLGEHYEQVPCSDWYLDEYGNEVQDYETQKVNGWFPTYEDELAYFCWKCGCNLFTHQDYWSGDCTFWVSLPTTKEEEQKNIEEGNKFWEEEIL